MSAQSEQVTCGCGQCEWAPAVCEWIWIREFTVKHCPDCGDKLGDIDGTPTVTPMVPQVASEAVQGTRLYEVLAAIVAHMDGHKPMDEQTVRYCASLRLCDLLENIGEGACGMEVRRETTRVLFAALQQSPAQAGGASDE